jgi:hypothetical protein
MIRIEALEAKMRDGGDEWAYVRDQDILLRRARSCREQARVTHHPCLAEAFTDLAIALEFAASVADMVSHRVLH